MFIHLLFQSINIPVPSKITTPPKRESLTNILIKKRKVITIMNLFRLDHLNYSTYRMFEKTYTKTAYMISVYDVSQII